MQKLFISFVFAVTFVESVVAAPKPKRPNILLIMADDLGFSDVGCFGGEIQTPNLDALADGGLRFSNFYNTGRCWPTRASLLTGFYPQAIRRDKIEGVKSGARGKRPAWAPLICKPLHRAGYSTYHTGKWHIDSMPIKEGFDESYLLKDQHRFFNPTVHYRNDDKLPAVQPDQGFYGTVALGDHAVETLRKHAQTAPEKPFFHYLAFTAPHFPLHALPSDIAKYKGRYEKGWNIIQQERHQRQLAMGLLEGELSKFMPEVGPPYAFPDAIKQLGDGETNRPTPWNNLTFAQKRFQARKMEIHAAMVDCLDQQIGRVLDQLGAMDQLANTLILFLSDNGASAEIMVRGDGHDPNAEMGSWQSHLCLGPGWSTASNTPFRYHKTWNHEGGIATPLIVHWPERIPPTQNGNIRNQAGHVIDIWPTIIDAAQASDGVKDKESQFLRPGSSLLPCLDGKRIAEQKRVIWWSHDGNRALRKGDWKISFAKSQSKDWELYNLKEDRSETKNLATSNSEKKEELAALWQKMQLDFLGMANTD